MRREHDLSDTELASQALQGRMVDTIHGGRSARHRDRSGQVRGWRQVLVDRAEALNIAWRIDRDTAEARADIDTETVVAVLIAVVNIAMLNRCSPPTRAQGVNADRQQAPALPSSVVVSARFRSIG